MSLLFRGPTVVDYSTIMACKEHLKVLDAGIGEWNKWRKANKRISPDLSGADLDSKDLQSANLDGSNLSGTRLVSANLAFSTISEACLAWADLGGANLNMVTGTAANLRNARLFEACLFTSRLRGANLEYSSLEGSNLSYANLENAILEEAELFDARLFRTRLKNANLKRAKLQGAFIYDVEFGTADFTGVELGATTISNSDLSKVVGLEDVVHVSPSTIGIDTIYRSRGNISDRFLRAAGIPETLLVYMHSVTRDPLEFYTCFISYSEADDAFSQRLYNDLQQAGVRCWRWKEDAVWGKPLMESIDEAVTNYDKLIVICSEHSLNSPPVLREIERALQREDVLGRRSEACDVLFPIRLDDYIFNEWTHYRKADLIHKHIGDFRHWEQGEAYSNSLTRLIRDLKTAN